MSLTCGKLILLLFHTLFTRRPIRPGYLDFKCSRRAIIVAIVAKAENIAVISFIYNFVHWNCDSPKSSLKKRGNLHSQKLREHNE